MYMHYLLNYQPWSPEHTDSDSKRHLHDIYLLTLDGDVDFQPDAVQQMVNMLRADDKLAAVGGHSHPSGICK